MSSLKKQTDRNRLMELIENHKKEYSQDISGSYSTKFSRHLIFEDVIFEDNITCGRFVKDFVEQWNEEEVRERWGEEYSSIFYNEEKVEEGMDVDSTCTGLTQNLSKIVTSLLPKKSIIDTSVYTKNRLFRILGSTKFGKKVGRLKVMNESMWSSRFYSLHGLDGSLNKELQNVNSPNIILPSSYDNLASSLDFEELSIGFERTFVCPIFVDKVLTYEGGVGGGYEWDWREGIDRIKKAYAGTLNPPTTASFQGTTETNIQPPPFNPPFNPDEFNNNQITQQSLHNLPTYGIASNLTLPSCYSIIDSYVNTILGRLNLKENKASYITTYSIVKTSTYKSKNSWVERLSYNMKQSSGGGGWCSNVGRWHKSNGIIYQVDLGENVRYRQMCFDADCRGYRSRWVIIPELQTWWEEQIFEREMVWGEERREEKARKEREEREFEEEMIKGMEEDPEGWK
ncbi:hypothetical protein TrLO_g12406 [Triparma laevis f. longispina]|uniref:DNA-directed primase/polymerase protein n=1 Tax=Triparma laevis f. longispina TaxID=1714387 RepID=A0A9W7FPZ0_9STRA|nr:hypothetical protein TrLO_g12406 [Triparma laevis f. longispina]